MGTVDMGFEQRVGCIDRVVEGGDRWGAGVGTEDGGWGGGGHKRWRRGLGWGGDRRGAGVGTEDGGWGWGGVGTEGGGKGVEGGADRMQVEEEGDMAK